MEDRQHNDQPKNVKGTNNDLQNTTHKTKDRVIRTPLKTGLNSGAPEGKVVPALKNHTYMYDGIKCNVTYYSL